MKRNIKGLSIALALLAAVGIVGDMDYEDAVREQAAYCENVKVGAWPDCNGTYKTECTAERLKEFQNILR